MEIVSNKVNLDKSVAGVYVCDLLSWVMSNANENDLWITVLTNINVVAVAMLTDVACVVIPESIEIESETITKAENEGVTILRSDMSAYEICIRAHELLREF